MCPYKKFAWFRTRGYSEDDIKNIRNQVVNQWQADYQQLVPSSCSTSPLSVSSAHVSLQPNYQQGTANSYFSANVKMGQWIKSFVT
jgi:hypothetical protein